GEPAGQGPVTEPPDPDPAAADRRALLLLGRAAVLALEGAPRPGRRPRTVRAPLPRHAADLLARLLAGRGTCAQFQAALRKTHDRPAEVTRARRAAHVAVLTAFVLVGAGCCMFPAGWIMDMAPGMMQVGQIGEKETRLRSFDEAEPPSLAVSF